MIFEWQKTQWQQFRRLIPKLPHALLFFGPRGTGKLEFARTAAALLLCRRAQSTADLAEACGECATCILYRQGNHPDFFLIQPEADAEAAEGEPEAAAPVDKKKKPSKQIKIAQVREVLENIQTGTHQGGRRVILVAPAEAMNAATANALLKTLEEPPPDTVMLLVSSEPDRLLPTIRSRCQSLGFGEPDRGLALNWLKENKINDADSLLARFGGAPLMAFDAASEETGTDMNALAERLLASEDPLASAELLAVDPAAAVDSLQRWVSDLVTLRLGGRVRYYPGLEKALVGVARTVPILSLLKFARRLTELRAIAHHPVNPRLFAERLALDYADAVRAQR